MNRTITRVLLGISLVAAFATGGFAFYSAGPTNTDAWATVAAALAVITSVIASWSSQRVLEQHEDAQKPNPFPTIDFKSRRSLILFRITNYGGSVARDIEIEWDVPLKNSQGQIVSFTIDGKGGTEIYVLPPGESLALLVDTSVDFFNAYGEKPVTFSGTIKYKDASGKQMNQKFELHVHQLAKTLIADNEVMPGFRSLQDIPKELKEITRQLRYIEDVLRNDEPSA